VTTVVYAGTVRAADWDQKYTDEPGRWSRGAGEVVEAALSSEPPGDAVDLACGPGRHARWLADRGHWVTAVDFSPTAVEIAKNHVATEGNPAQRDCIEWVVADVFDWEPVGVVDLVLVAYLHLPQQDLTAVLRRAAGWLRPAGRLLYIGHAQENLLYGVGGPQEALVLPTAGWLAAAADGSRVRDLRHVERDTEHGRAVDILLDLSPWPA
jgi:SAM-dependent methyltransferase